MILSLGSINADVQLRVDRWPPDVSLVPAREPLCASGGKAGNVAVFVGRLGVDARLVGCVDDDDLAEQALRGPRGAGVDLGGLRVTPGPHADGWVRKVREVACHSRGARRSPRRGGAAEMEQRGPPHASLALLDDLRALVGAAGPYLTAYLSLRPATEDLTKATRLTWADLREEAVADGAPDTVVGGVDAVITDAHRRGQGLCVVASLGGDVHVEPMVEAPARQLAAWQAAPVLAPLIAERQWIQPHLVVLADRVGAQIIIHADRSLEPTETLTVRGDTDPIRKSHPGGWSQRRFQQRAEETWPTRSRSRSTSSRAYHRAELGPLRSSTPP